MTDDEAPMKVETRMIIRGHKNGQDFVNHRNLYSEADVQRSSQEMLTRMEDPPTESWQPTITGFSIEERYITPWRETTRRP